MYFLISTVINGKPKYNSFYWGGKYLSDIIDYLDCDYNLLAGIKQAILYYNKSEQKTNNVLLLNITSVEAKQSYLKIYFEISKELDYQSYHIKNALKNYMNMKSIYELPFVSVVDELKFFDILNDGKIYSTIKTLEEKNNWQEIYKLLQSFEPIEKSKIWNDAILLNSFSFATAKLSECTENLKKIYPDKNKRNQIIDEKRKFRELTIRLRIRAIELEPNNASYYSNLAYTYYQSVNELLTPGSRRDGNIFDEATLALKNINKSLSLNPERLTDLYRKAVIYSDFLGEQKFFRNFDKDKTQEKYNEYLSSLNEAIQSLIEVEKIYNKIQDNEQKQKQKKIYIKCLYHLSQLYLKISKINNNYNSQKISPDEINEKVLETLSLADKYIDLCIKIDYNKKKNETEIKEMCHTDNFISGVYKSYLKGVIQLYLFSITKEKEYEIAASRFLQISMETNFPKEMKNQNKIFILDKIATFNIIKGNYQAAIKTLEPLYNRYQNLPPYAAYTLALSFIENKNMTKAHEIIKKYLQNTNEIFEHKFKKLSERITLNQQIGEPKTTSNEKINHESEKVPF